MNDWNWNEMFEWDKKYCMHVNSALDELAPLSIAKTEGEYLVLSDGRKLLDFLAGYISVALGQRNQRIFEEIKKAMQDYAYVPEIYVTPYKSTAAKLIINDLLGPDNWAGRVHFVNSGSEANEEALQIAKLFTNRPYIITREYSYHGWTEAAGACTRVNYQRGTLSSPNGDYVRRVPGFPAPGYFPATAPYCYRCPYGFKGPDTCKVDGKVSCLNDLEHTIKSLGPENVAAVIAEPISGSSAIVSPRDWVRELREITQKHGILWIDDEVITGFGRTGKWFGYQHYGVTPDIMTLGKGIASSHLPASAVVISKEIADFFDKYRWHHAVTFSSHPLVMAAVVANLKEMIEKNIPEKAAKSGKYLAKRLVEQETLHQSIGQITGTGLLYGVEFVKNRTTREPIVAEDRDTNVTGDTKHWPVSIVRKRGIEKGVLFAGIVPNALRLGPTLTISEGQIDQAMTALDYGVSEVDRSIPGKT